jgi:hypothetical protein
MKHFRVFALVSICGLAASMSPLAAAQAPALDLNTEASLLQHTPPTTGPIVVNWAFKKGAGSTNLTVNPDGTYVFSGQYSGKKPNKDFDIALALKASTGAILLFHYMGDAANGAQWSDQGQSEILKDDFALFAGKTDWTAEYHFSESSAGKRAEYEAKKKRLEDLRKAEEEARKKKDAKLVAEKKAARRREEQAELAQEQQAAQQHSGGGGSSVVSTIGDVCSGIASVAGDVGGAVSAVESLFSF